MPAMRTPHPLAGGWGVFRCATRRLSGRRGCRDYISDVLTSGPFFKQIVIVHCTNGKQYFAILSACGTSGIPDLRVRRHGRLDSPSWI